MSAWQLWVKWNRSMEQTLIDAQHLAAGDVSLGEAQKQASRTGSPGILTVHELSDHQMLGRIWVLTGEDLHDRFGSRTPAKKVIEADHDAFVESLERGQAVAVTAYLRGQPTAVLFAGQPDGVKKR
ncbi:MAG: hypothetical protein U0228_06860 [Myxococcaceae bacterium]